MRTTGFRNSAGEDLGSKFVDRDYLYSLYPSIPRGGLTLFGWGNNSNGQIGDNTTANRSTPRQEFTSSTNWKQVAGDINWTVAIKTDGTLWGWGYNGYGQLGDNTQQDRRTPRQEFTSSTNWKQVSAGGYQTAAIKTDGTLWCWGNNNLGQLGDNTTSNRFTPRQEFTSSTNWKQVHIGRNFIVAIKSDGTLWGWGNGNSGQLADNRSGNSNFRSTPLQEFTSSTNWKQVVGGFTSAVAIKNDGTLWMWGLGNLGVNDNVTRSTPVREFTSSTNWKQCSTDGGVTAAIKTDGTLWLWGSNNYGQLGVNDNVTRSTPVREFTSSTNWKQVSVNLQIVAIKTDGTLWCWGFNSFGEVGDNTTAFRSTPRQEFTSSTNWVQSTRGVSRALKAPPFVE